MSYILIDAVERNRQHPTTFEIPNENDIANLTVGGFAKLGFEEIESPDGYAERMWVKVTNIGAGGTFEGTLANDPIVIESMSFGDKVQFKRDNILDVGDPSSLGSDDNDG